MVLSTEAYGGGFQVFASKRGSSLLAQLWSENPGEPQWTAWLCFDSLPQPDRMAGHAVLDGTLEVFATTLCGDLYRRVIKHGTGWLPWAQFSLPPAGKFLTDVAMSETSAETDVVFVADGGRVFARARLGTEPDSPYAADWQEIPDAPNATVVTAGMRSDKRQQVFVLDANGAVFTAIQSTSAPDSPFSGWSNFDLIQLPLPLVDIEAPLGGPILEVFAVDTSGALWQRAQDPATGFFGDWKPWDGPPPPSALLAVAGAGLKFAANTPLRLTVMTKTRHIYTVRRTGSVWGEWRLFP